MKSTLRARWAGALLACLAPALGAQPAAQTGAPPRSAQVSNLRYEVTFDRAMAERQRMRVTTTFDVAGSEPVLLSLPAWTPGAYEISNFARWVTAFDASADGRPLPWDKLDPDTWRIRQGGARKVTVSFEFFADSLDNAMSWSTSDFLMFNGTNVFLYPEGRPFEFRAQVSVKTDPSWRVVTGMKWEGPNTFSATNYHDLVDMPFFVGRFDVDSQQVSGKWMRLATYPSGSVSGAQRARVWDWLRRGTPPLVNVFGETPWDTYTVMQVADSSYAGASGLEHQNSHVDVLTPFAVQSDFMPSLYAHEIFHAWNVKRLRPADLWPYVYDRAQPTPWLWMSEGVTDYYADLALVRGGITDENGFYAFTANKLSEVANVPVVALEDASLSTWIHPVEGTGYIYYPKGSLAGLMLDILIRDASDNAHSLDDVMRELYRSAYKAGRGFTADEWWSAVTRAAGGKSFEEFRAKYIDGREPFPMEQLLALAGMRAGRVPTPRLGVSSMQDSTGVRVTEVDSSGAAAAAGVRVGDYLVSVGDIPVDDQLFGEKFRARYGRATEGSPLTITVRRAAQTVNLKGQLRFVPGDFRVERLPNASAKATRIREGILTGTTGRQGARPQR